MSVSRIGSDETTTPHDYMVDNAMSLVVANAPLALSYRNMNTVMVVRRPGPSVHDRQIRWSREQEEYYWYMYDQWCYHESDRACSGYIARIHQTMENISKVSRPSRQPTLQCSSTVNREPCGGMIYIAACHCCIKANGLVGARD